MTVVYEGGLHVEPNIYIGDHFIFRDYKWKVIGLSEDLTKAALSRIDLSDRFENIEIESFLKSAVRVKAPPKINWLQEGVMAGVFSVVLFSIGIGITVLKIDNIKAKHEQVIWDLEKKHRLELWEADKRFLKHYEWGIIEDGETIDIVEGEGVKVERVGDKLHVTIKDDTTDSTTDDENQP